MVRLTIRILLTHQSKELFTKMFDCQETVPQPNLPLKFENIMSWPSGSVSDSFRNLAQVRFPLESVSDIQRLYILGYIESKISVPSLFSGYGICRSDMLHSSLYQLVPKLPKSASIKI